MVYSTALERRHTERYREFESHRLRSMKKYFVALLMLIVIAGFSYAAWTKRAHTNPMQTVTIGATVFNVEVADTEPLRPLGQGNRSSLPRGQGMLFVFDRPGAWGIWMKDMHFAIDVVWAHADGTVTAIVRDMGPSTYPAVFSPKTPDAKYVLEVASGAAAGIAEGTKMMVQ